jgi:hypothetical protein
LALEILDSLKLSDVDIKHHYICHRYFSRSKLRVIYNPPSEFPTKLCGCCLPLGALLKIDSGA